MAASAWKEIEQLKEDLKKAQSTSSQQKLSERNCIELMMKLEYMKLLDILHTIDGKEYITPNQLGTEIYNELYVHRGRISIAELQVALNVNYSHIEAKVQELSSSDKSLSFVLGELIQSSYVDHLAEEINDLLQSTGQVTISDICKIYNLPADFIVPELKSRFGRIILGKMDSGNEDAIFTDAFVERHRAYIRGRCTGITRPTLLKSLLNESQIPSKLFFSIINELLNDNRISGNLIGGNTENSTFIPAAYTKLQRDWINSFYRQNSYIEFDAIRRIGVDNAKLYVKEHFKDAIILELVALQDNVIQQIAANIEDNIEENKWMDIMNMTPVPLSEQDGSRLLQHILSTMFPNQMKGMLINETCFATKSLVESSSSYFDDFIKQRADKDAKTKASSITEDEMKRLSNQGFTQDSKKNKKDDRKQKVDTRSSESGGGGAGVRAREHKTKGKDKKRLKRMKEVEDKNRELEEIKTHAREQEKEFFTMEDIEEILSNNIPDLPENLLSDLSSLLFSLMSDSKTESKDDKKSKPYSIKPRKHFEEEINVLWTNVQLYSEAVQHFQDDTETDTALQRHLLSTLCTDLVNVLFNMMAVDVYLSVENSADLTSEIRLNIISKLPKELKNDLIKINSLITGKSLPQFKESFQEIVAEGKCDVMLKKCDKKKERQTIYSNKLALLDQLNKEKDLAMSLHLASLIVFQNAIGQMIHAPGRCVPVILSFLRRHIPEEAYSLLIHAQDLVMKKLTMQENKEPDKDMINDINTTLQKLKDLPPTIKKSTNK